MTLIIITILLLCCAAFANSMMDVLNFRYSTSSFAEWGQKETDWGQFWQMWAGPDSWRNKYKFSGFWGWLFRGPLVFLTDAWHCSQFIMWTCLQVALALWIAGPFWLWLIGMKIGMGMIFEAGWRVLQEEKTVLGRSYQSRGIQASVKIRIRSARPILMSWIAMVLTFFLTVAAFNIWDGDPSADWSTGATAAIVVLVLCQVLFWGLRAYIVRKNS